MLAGGTEASGTRDGGSASARRRAARRARGRRLPPRRRRDRRRPRRRSCSSACTRCRLTRTRRSSSSSATARSGTCSQTVLGERGGAPLHYLLAYLAGLVDPGPDEPAAHLGRASPSRASRLIAALVARLTDRRTALLATLARRGELDDALPRHLRRACTACSSSRRCSRCSSSCGRSSTAAGGRWAAWAAATLALLATQPYGVLVLVRRSSSTSPCSASGGRSRCALR